MAGPLNILFLWHMHQPFYRDPLRGEYALPWTYLHAIKDYYDMAAIVQQTPGAKAVFNLVPSLIEQLEEYAAGEAVDPILKLGKLDPADLDEDGLTLMLDTFFSANRQRMIEPYPRYLELLHLAGDGDPGRKADHRRSFRRQEILDLQVWFFLAWTGEAARRTWPELAELVRKGRNYSPADKELLFARHREILGAILPLYRQLHEEGKAELSVSPYFHPILPLLCDMKSALGAMPRANLPTARFQHPEDAKSQIEEGLDCFRRVFGFTPAGMWPSEGSVSDESLELIASSGIRWVATDEGILATTLSDMHGAKRGGLYHPYAFKTGSGELKMIFRDHALSDLIGFTYSQWDTKRAITDFVGRLGQVRAEFRESKVVPVILDGENAWEYYPDNGYDFLKGLYAALADSKEFRVVTACELLDCTPSRQVLTHIHPGSWINANFGVWVGHHEENLGWDYLERARATAVSRNPQVAQLLAEGKGSGNPAVEADGTARLICRSLYAAEGSDWFWWYGDDHFSPHSDRFDALFRRHLMNVYRLLGLDIPRELYEPIKKKSPAGFVREPASFISPYIDGLVTDYFEWLAAGLFDLSRQSSAMHASESALQSFFYGYDRDALYFRIDGTKDLNQILREDEVLNLHLIARNEYLLPMVQNETEGLLQVKVSSGFRSTGWKCSWKITRICEVCVPIAAVGSQPKEPLSAYLTLVRNGEEVGRWPVDAPMALTYLGEELELDNWLI